MNHSQSIENRRSLPEQNSSEDEEKRHSRLCHVANKTNCHAVGDIYNTEPKTLRCCSFLALGCFFIVAIRALSCEFICFAYAKPMTSYITVDAEILKLPNVAICDTEGLNLTKLVAEGFSNRSEDLMSMVPPEGIDTDQKRQHEVIQAFMTKKGIKSYSDFITQYAYDCASVIHDISIADKVELCSPKRSWHIHHHYFYNCWAIDVGYQDAPGVGAGARIGVNRPFDPVRDNIGLRSEGFAIEMFPGHRPYSTNPSMIPYNTASTVAISKKIFHRLKTSHLRGSNMCSTAVEYGGNCQTDCFTGQTYANCGCEWLGMRDPSNFTNPNASYCTTWEFNRCVNTIDNHSLHKCQMKCRPLCRETSFEPVISTLKKTNDDDDGVATFFLGYPVLRTIELDQADSYTLTGLFSNVGGQLGLWLGMSVASIVQMFVLLVTFEKPKQPSNIIERSTNVYALPAAPSSSYEHRRMNYGVGNRNTFATHIGDNNYYRAEVVPCA